MSERNIRPLAVLAVALACGAIPASAQRDEAALTTQRRRVQALERAWRSAWEAAELAKRGYLATAPFDTVRVGALKIVAHSTVRDQAQRVAEIAWTDLQRQFGSEARAVERRVFRLTIAGGSDLPSYGVGDNVVDFSVRSGTGDEAIAAAVSRSAASFIWSQSDLALLFWLQGIVPRKGDWIWGEEARGRFAPREALGLLPLAPRDLARYTESQYIALALTPLSRVRECYAGAVAACRAALGLNQGDALLAWFSAADRGPLVRSLDARPRERFSDRDATDRCLRGSDSACVALLRGRYIRPPLSEDARALLTGVALEMGGEGAYSRLLRNPRRAVADRLAAAAGVSTDSLVAVWRARVLAARPDRAARLPRRSVWVLVGWVALFAMAAMRSVRWRHI